MLRRIFIGIVLAALVAPVGTAQHLQDRLAAYNRGDDVTTPRGLPPLALKGDANAQNKLAFMYLRGEGVPQDDAKAMEWFHKAAEQGHIRAQYNLAVLYHIGIGARPSDAKAEEWFRRAAEQGHGAAKINLIFMRKNSGRLTIKAPPAPTHKDLCVPSVAAENGQGVAIKAPPAAAVENLRVQSGAGEKAQGAVLKAPLAPARGDFRVQLGSVKLKARAVREAGRLNRIHTLVLGDLKVVPVRANLGKRGIFYRLRAGPLTDRASAKSLCRKLSTPKQGCMVARLK